MVIDIHIYTIKRIQNDIIEGQFNGAEFFMDLKPKIKEDKIHTLDIRWTFCMNINAKQYIIHKSKTVFNCDGLLLDENMLSDSRVDVISQLGQISMAHSRSMFFDDNKKITGHIPLMLWYHEMIKNVKEQLSAYLN